MSRDLAILIDISRDLARLTDILFFCDVAVLVFIYIF